MSKTEKNLMDAFAGESQANRKYLAFAKQADKEGLDVYKRQCMIWGSSRLSNI